MSIVNAGLERRSDLHHLAHSWSPAMWGMSAAGMRVTLIGFLGVLDLINERLRTSTTACFHGCVQWCLESKSSDSVGLLWALEIGNSPSFRYFCRWDWAAVLFFSFAAWSSTTIPQIFIVSILVMDGFVCKREDWFVDISLRPFVYMQLYTYLESAISSSSYYQNSTSKFSYFPPPSIPQHHHRSNTPLNHTANIYRHQPGVLYCYLIWDIKQVWNSSTTMCYDCVFSLLTWTRKYQYQPHAKAYFIGRNWKARIVSILHIRRFSTFSINVWDG